MINQIKLKLSLLETLYLCGINGKGLLKNHDLKIKMSPKVEVTQSCGKLTNWFALNQIVSLYVLGQITCLRNQNISKKMANVKAGWKLFVLKETQPLLKTIIIIISIKIILVSKNCTLTNEGNAGFANHVLKYLNLAFWIDASNNRYVEDTEEHQSKSLDSLSLNAAIRCV